MVRTLVKLQRTLWSRLMNDNVSLIIVSLMFATYAILGALGINALLISEGRGGQLLGLATVLSIGLLAHVMSLLVVPSGENQLQPEQFIGLDISPNDFFKAHMAAAVMNSRATIALLCSVLTAIAACFTIAPVWWAAVIVLMVLQLCITVVGGELVTTLLGSQKERAKRERTTALSTLGVVVLLLGYNKIMSNFSDMPQLWRIGRFAQWTPLGATGGAVAALVDGNLVRAMAQILIAGITLVALAWLWRRKLIQRLVAPLDQGNVEERKKNPHVKGSASAYVPLVPRTPAGAIYSRALRYFRRDPRLTNTLFILPIFSFFFLYQAYSLNNDFNLYLGLFMIAFMGCSLCANDFGYDGPAMWQYIASGMRPRDVAWARHLASLTIPFGFGLIYALAASFLAKDSGVARIVIPAALLSFLVTSAIGQLLTVFNPYPTAPPGTNPWADRSGYSGAAFLSAMITLFTGWIPVVPGMVLLFVHRSSGQLWQAVLGWVLLIGLPLLLFAIARVIASRRIDRKFPEIFAKVNRHVK